MSEGVDLKPGDEARAFRAISALDFERLESAFQRRLDQKVEGLHGRLTRAFRAISALERRQNLVAREFGHLCDASESALALAEQLVGRIEQLVGRIEQLEKRSESAFVGEGVVDDGK